MSEAAGHGTILIVLWDDILVAAVEIRPSDVHLFTVLTGRSRSDTEVTKVSESVSQDEREGI